MFLEIYENQVINSGNDISFMFLTPNPSTIPDTPRTASAPQTPPHTPVSTRFHNPVLPTDQNTTALSFTVR